MSGDFIIQVYILDYCSKGWPITRVLPSFVVYAAGLVELKRKMDEIKQWLPRAATYTATPVNQ